MSNEISHLQPRGSRVPAPNSAKTDSSRGTVILGVAASDTHVVANHLIAHMLRENGYTVVNLGACTPLRDFMDAYASNENVIAIVIGSLNGHAKDDLRGLLELKQEYGVRCPVVLGGNLSVGSQKELGLEEYFMKLGVDIVQNRPELLAKQLHLLSSANSNNTNNAMAEMRQASGI
ncbi:cobalamin-binding protein [Cystobacter fuscus]|uniref:Cobalamin-binding protein n=1 Tax=Cystobacter fuscus TaxID=43 RepID=A0A250J167_9BACT|nr:cobalamin-dependent protein [Cystobacter fuscus]ATB37734.1 cobalamin-binding protein [Cystobacter fuscus]